MTKLELTEAVRDGIIAAFQQMLSGSQASQLIQSQVAPPPETTPSPAPTPSPAAEKPKPEKAKKDTKPKPEPTPEATPTPTPTPEPEAPAAAEQTSDKPLTFDDVKPTFMEYYSRASRDQVSHILGKYGATRLSGVPEKDYAAALADFKAALAELDGSK